jgi:hypothetical protein
MRAVRLFGIAVVFLASIVASAAKAASPAPCQIADLSTYLASGFTCSAGDVVYSQFSLSASASGGASALTGSDIVLDPSLSFPGVGESFVIGPGNGTWQAGAGQTLDTTISYTASYLPGWAPAAWGWGFPLGPYNLTSDGSAQFNWTITNPGLGTVISNLNTCYLPSCTLLLAENLPQVTPLTLTDNFVLSGGATGSASLPGDAVFFVDTAVPEPAAWTLILMGIGGLGAGLRMARRKNGLGLTAA